MSADPLLARADAGAESGRPAQVPFRLLPAWPTAAPASLDDHLTRHGPVAVPLAADVDRVLAEVGRSGLTGRGGAAFPTARKIAAVAAAPGRPAVVVNGTEGEPASAKDKVLLSTQPHLVLDGAAVAGAIVGATKVIVVVHTDARRAVDHAVAERRIARIDQLTPRVLTAASGFVAGEASAVVNWAGRGIPLPTRVPPRLAEHGLGGQPTLVHNAETLAHLALIARHGAGWFRSAGTAAEPGTMLVTISGAVRMPCVTETPIGLPVAEILARAGGPDRALSALLIGGYFGAWVPWPAAASLPFSSAGLADSGAGPGAGVIVALPRGACGLVETARVAAYLAAESAGQCGPCVFGLAAIAGELRALADGRVRDLGALRRWLVQVDGRGACRHPDGAVRFVRSALRVFGTEVEQHREGWCRATEDLPILPTPARAGR